MSLEVVKVQIRGGKDSVVALLDGLPGSYEVEPLGDDVYDVATPNAGFLRYAITNQGYGTVLT